MVSLIKKFLKDQRGAISFEMGIAMLIMLILLPPLYKASADQFNNLKAMTAADRISKISLAAREYVVANVVALEASTAASPITITPATLMAGGFLPPSFLDNNSYGQTHVILIRRLGAQEFEIVSLSQGGQNIDFVPLVKAALLLGANGGFIDELDTSKIIGVNKGWEIPWANYATTGILLVGGHLAKVDYYGRGQTLGEFIYRNSVGGFPEANRMNTDLDLNNNNLNNVQDIYISSLGDWVSNLALISTTIVGNGDTITKPTCPNGNPALFLSTSMITDGSGNPISGFQVLADDLGATWSIRIRVASQIGTVEPALDSAKAVAFVKCI